MLTINLTPTEAEVLNHRLEVQDAMVDVFEPYNTDTPWADSRDEVERMMREVIGAIFFQKPNGGLIATFDPSNRIHLELMTEVVEGNTMGSIAYDLCQFSVDEPNRREGERLMRAIRSVEAKYEAAGLMVAFNC